MTASAATDLCRLTVVAPTGSAEVAVPADVAVIDLLPTLLSHASGGLADAGLEHDGWVVQRLGEPPLDEDRTPAVLGLKDGETLYLRPRAAELPTLDFDDLIDGVSTAMRDRADRWREAMTRRLFLGVMTVALGLGVGVLLLAGPPAGRAVAAAAAAVVLVLAGTAACRALADPTAGTLLGLAALPYAALGGLIAPAVRTGGGLLTGPGVLGAGAATVVVALLASGGVGRARPVFLSATVVAAVTGGAGLLATLTSLGAARVAAVAVAVALAFMPVIPTLSFRLARMRLPPLPTDSEQLQEDIDPIQGDLVLVRAATADRYMAALFAAVGAVATGCLTLLCRAGGTAALVLAGLVGATLLLRSRVLLSGWQRMAMVVPGVWGTGALVLTVAAGLRAGQRTGEMLVSLIAAALLGLAGARLLPGRRLLPYWGRLADVGESLLGAAVLPTVLAVLGVYSFARTLGG